MKTIARRRGGKAEKHDEAGREKIATHHEDAEELKHAKHVGPIQGEHGRATGGRAPRKNGGEVGADRRPFSSARHGTEPKGRHTMAGDD
jgi:hypothetical protein